MRSNFELATSTTRGDRYGWSRMIPPPYAVPENLRDISAAPSAGGAENCAATANSIGDNRLSAMLRTLSGSEMHRNTAIVQAEGRKSSQSRIDITMSRNGSATKAA